MKKIISLLMVCFMLVSMTAVVSADTGVTFSVVVSDELDMDGVPYYLIAINMDGFYTQEADLEKGYIGMQLDLTMDDSTKGVFLEAAEPGEVTYSQKKVNPVTQKVTWNVKDAATSVANQDASTIRLVHESPSKSDTVLLSSGYDAGNALGYIYFMPTEGATGKLNFSLTYVECAIYNGETHYTEDFSYDYSNATIDFGGEEEGDDEPVATTVKTFAKRLYLDNTLYTVGVISEGTNFATETIKAGINIEKGDSTVNYWTTKELVSNNAGLSYYIVGLNDVTETTDITVNSKSKAIITVNGGDIIDANDAIGAEATDLEADIIKDAE